jgi:hypothetical protein
MGTPEKLKAPLAAVAPLVVASACALPHRPAALPPRSEGYVAVLSGEMPGAISQVARHAWIVANVPGEPSFRRFELGGGGSGDPFRYFGGGEVAVHGIVHYQGDELAEKVDCLAREEQAYDRQHPDYFPIPGPNSNTIVDFMLRHCSIHVELPATAIGRDYRGLIGASVTSLGTGVQLETWAVGVKLGLEEGVEVHVLDLPLGVHLWPPAITVPVNPGRIGFDDSMYRDAPERLWHRRRYDEDDDFERRYGVASLWLWSRYARIAQSQKAGGLSDLATVGFETRGAYGRHIGYGFGVDLEAGAGFPLGFAYAARLYPAGAVLMFGGDSFLGLYGGIGSDGVTEHVPARFALPAELRLEIDVAPMARVGARAGVAWYPGSTSREGGRLSPFADELVLSAFARIGRALPRGRWRYGRGYFFALERREVMQTFSLGLTFGVEADLGG